MKGFFSGTERLLNAKTQPSKLLPKISTPSIQRRKSKLSPVSLFFYTSYGSYNKQRSQRNGHRREECRKGGPPTSILGRSLKLFPRPVPSRLQLQLKVRVTKVCGKVFTICLCPPMRILSLGLAWASD